MVGRRSTVCAHSTVVVIIFHEATKSRRKKETFMGTEIMWVDLETEKLLIYILCDLGASRVLIVGRSLLRNILLTTIWDGTRASGHAFAVYAQGTAPDQTTILDAPSANADDRFTCSARWYVSRDSSVFFAVVRIDNGSTTIDLLSLAPHVQSALDQSDGQLRNVGAYGFRFEIYTKSATANMDGAL